MPGTFIVGLLAAGPLLFIGLSLALDPAGFVRSLQAAVCRMLPFDVRGPEAEELSRPVPAAVQNLVRALGLAISGLAVAVLVSIMS